MDPTGASEPTGTSESEGISEPPGTSTPAGISERRRLPGLLGRLGLLEAELAVGEIRAPALDLLAQGLSLRTRVHPGRPLAAGRWRAEALRDTRSPARFAPLWARGRFAPLAPEASRGGLELDAVLADAPGRLVVELHGRHDLATGRGRARLRLHPLRLAATGGEQGVELQRLVPLLEGVVAAQAGRVEASGEVRWSGSGGADLAGRVDLVVRGADLATPYANVRGLDAGARVQGPWPLTTPPGQRVTMERLDPGLPLEDGRILFHLRRSTLLVLESARWRLAEGTLRTSGSVDLGAPTQRLVFEVEGVRLGPLLRHLAVPGLSGSGTVDGRLPVVRTPAGLALEDGHLEARGSGWIRYEPPSGVSATLRGATALGGDALVAALQNFHYRALEVRLDGALTGDARIRLHLAGANPDYRDGHPVEFNLDLQVELGSLLRARALSRRVPEEIEERLRRREEAP